MVKLIVFDWDDVFTLGSTEGYYACYHAALQGVGITLTPVEVDQRIRSKWGSGHTAQLEDLLREHPELVEDAVELYEKNFYGDTFVNALRVVPGSQSLVQQLSSTYKLAVATGGHPKILKERVLKKFQFPEVFDQILTIYDIDDIAHAKPHPHMLHQILETQQVSAADTIFVGDAKNDVLMAQAAGVEPVVVLTGHLTREEAVALKVRYIIDDVTKLPQLLAVDEFSA